MNFYVIITLISLIVHAGLATLAMFKNKRGCGTGSWLPVNLAFIWAMFAVVVMEGGRLIFLAFPEGANALLWIRISLVGRCLLPANFFLFSLLLGQDDCKEAINRGKRYLIPFYLITLVFLAFTSSDLFLKQIAGEYPGYQFIYGRIGQAQLIFSLLVILAILANLENMYRQMQTLGTSSLQNKGGLRIKYPILVLIVAFFFQILINSIAIAFSAMEIEFLIAASLTLLIANISIAYPVLLPSAPISKITISRNMISKSYTLLLAGLYLLIIGALGKIIQLIGKNLNFVLAFLGAFIVLLVLTGILVSKSLKQRFISFVERNFYKSKYDYRQEWENFSRRVFSTFELGELLREMVEVVSEALKVDKSLIMLKNEDKNEYFVAAPGLSIDDCRLKNLSRTIVFQSSIINQQSSIRGSEFLAWLWRYGKPLNLDSPTREVNLPEYYQENVEPLRQLGISVCVPIIAQRDLIAILMLGPKVLPNDKYTSEDIDLLETMANQLSIAITNAKFSEELIVSREMASFQRLSTFILHDLKNAVSMLSMLVENAEGNFDNPEFQKDALRTMSGAITRMQNLMTKFSSVPEKLELNLQLTDLSELIRDTIAKSGIKNLPRIRLNCDFQPVPKIMIDPEYIEKVILNLMTNAIEAIPPLEGGSKRLILSTSDFPLPTSERGGDVTLRLYSQDEFIHLEVRDTGCGMSREFINHQLFKPFQTTKKNGIGIGLYQCKIIVSAHGGQLETESTEGVGSTFTLKLKKIANGKI